MTCTTSPKELAMDDRNDLRPPAAGNSSPCGRKPSIDEKLDEALRQTFPATDPFEIAT